MKKLISDYGDVMANLCTKDVSKYDELTKYSKNAEFTQENFEKFLVDRSFPLDKKIKEMYSIDVVDEEGKYQNYNEK